MWQDSKENYSSSAEICNRFATACSCLLRQHLQDLNMQHRTAHSCREHQYLTSVELNNKEISSQF